MADMTADAGSPNLNLTPDEKRAYGQLFRQADTDNVGVVTGEVAVKFFEKTRLDSRVLGEIWQIADKENRGFLTPAGFGIVLRLIGHGQAGREPTPELALQPGPLPRFDGITLAPAPLSTQATGSASPAPLQAQGTGGGPIRIPPLTAEKVAQYTGLFERQNLLAGNLLPGDQAKQIFEKSQLPNEILGRIWQLADTEQRGALVLTEFVIAMHLLTSMKTGTLRGLPAILPAALYEAATRRGPAPGPRQQSPAATGPSLSAIPRQLSGQAQMRTSSPLGRAPVARQTTGDWLVTAPDKARFDQFFDELDKSKRGFITGDEAVPFLGQSNLPEDVLAQIWDLADFTSQGQLNRDTFAVAMYLIRQQRSKQGGSLPASLPPNLVPPSFRNKVRPPTATSAFDAPPPPQPAPPQPKSALDDLFGLDATPTPPTAAAAQTSLPTGAQSAAASDPFGSSASPMPPSSPAKASPTVSSFKPFVPSSTFGRTLTSQTTGDSNSSAPSFARATPQTASAQDDLLGDNDAEASKKLNSDTTELANLSNQIGSLSRHMQEVQVQRTNTQNELNQASLQKKNFEQRLTQLRAMYEKEAKDVRALEEQLSAARNETKKIQTEMAMLEGSHQDLQNQHRQVAGALQADQQENASLKERIRTVNAEVAQLKPQIEKLKSEARQQKGLVAINKKQLATNEGERDKLKTEAEELAKSNEELARQISSGSPSTAPAQVASPALSTTTANNPFFRRSGSTDIMGTFASPSAKAFNDKSFDDVFGPFPPPAQPATPPVTSFHPQHTGNSTASVGSFATPASSNTPTTSRQPTLAVDPPPPPPESRQMSSSFLPFLDASESLSSSRQVSPPVSRLGHADASSPEPAFNVVASPLEATATGQSIGSGSEPARTPTISPAPAPPPSNGGAFLEGAPASENAKPAISHSHNDSRSDPFSSTDQAKAKEDFESAFASFKTSKAKSVEAPGADAAKAFETFSTEFPPISELERDESDSESDNAGFDDDFAPASPRASGKAGHVKPTSPTQTKASPPEISAASGLGNSAATDDDITSGEKAAPSPSPATITGNITGSEMDDIFGSSSSKTEPAADSSQPTAAAGQSAKTPFDDLDDDFEGLEDAKEGSADDDFATISRSGLDDFNQVFDSSPPPSHAAKSESNMTGTTAPFGVESSFDFASLGSSAGGSTAGVGGSPAIINQNGSVSGSAGKGASGSDGHDWDAIFASLDEPAAPSAATPPDTTAKAAERPAPGRALTEDGEHDDPILKNLTSMGYSRTDALSALEKYDYNLERAANFLVTQSK